MATSSSTNYSLTARQLIEYALRKINILAEGESATAESADRAMTELNVLLKEWQKHPAVWRKSQVSLTPVASTASITMSSSTPTPYRVLGCRFRNTSSIDTPMTEMTYDEYYDLPNKSATGTPTTFMFDPQLTTNILYIWPLLSSVTTETIRATIQRRFEDVDDLANDIDVTAEHFSTVGLNLAARLADDYGRQGPHIDRVISRAEALAEAMQDADRPAFVAFMPGHR